MIGEYRARVCSLNKFILHQLSNKFFQLILIFSDSASWELHQYSHRVYRPMKILKLTPAPRNWTSDLMIWRWALYLVTTDTTQHIFTLKLCNLEE